MVIITEFERKVDVQNHSFGWLRFEIFLNYQITRTKNVIKFDSKLIRCLGTYFSIEIFSTYQC